MPTTAWSIIPRINPIGVVRITGTADLRKLMPRKDRFQTFSNLIVMGEGEVCTALGMALMLPGLTNRSTLSSLGNNYGNPN